MSCQSNSGLMQNRARLSVTVQSTHNTQVDDDDDRRTIMMKIEAGTVFALVVVQFKDFKTCFQFWFHLFRPFFLQMQLN